MSAHLLVASGLSHAFGGRVVTDDVSLRVDRGEIRAIIGPNGAGKTTLFNLLSGTLACRHGSIRFEDRNITSLPAHKRCRIGIGRTFQINNLFPEATVAQNIQLPLLIRYGRAWNPFVKAARLLISEVESLAHAVGLDAALGQRVGALPYGDRRRLELAIALAWDPKLLLLDEPACGIAIAERAALIQLICRVVRERGMSAILIEHDMDIVFSVAQRIAVLHRGRIVAEDTPAGVASDRQVQEIYLGHE